LADFADPLVSAGTRKPTRTEPSRSVVPGNGGSGFPTAALRPVQVAAAGV